MADATADFKKSIGEDGVGPNYQIVTQAKARNEITER
jgi:hypothetical protein